VSQATQPDLWQKSVGTNLRLSPSDFAFLWQECKRCFYLKVVKNFYRPRTVMPKVFTVIDSEMKKCFGGKRTETIAADMPGGVIQSGEKWVESRPIQLPNHSSTIFIKGKYDTVVTFDDKTYGVIDFKTSSAKPDHLAIYGRQLHGYAYALENPASSAFGLNPISRIGLLAFEPNNFANQIGSASLTGCLAWVEIPRDDQKFFQFLDEVVNLLEQPEPPKASTECEWCRYRNNSRRSGV
jgi:hypothetical protein